MQVNHKGSIHLAGLKKRDNHITCLSPDTSKTPRGSRWRLSRFPSQVVSLPSVGDNRHAHSGKRTAFLCHQISRRPPFEPDRKSSESGTDDMWTSHSVVQQMPGSESKREGRITQS